MGDSSRIWVVAGERIETCVVEKSDFCYGRVDHVNDEEGVRVRGRRGELKFNWHYVRSPGPRVQLRRSLGRD